MDTKEMDASEVVAAALAKQTYHERMEMARFLADIISDYYENNTEIPSATDVAEWLEAVVDNWPVA